MSQCGSLAIFSTEEQQKRLNNLINLQSLVVSENVMLYILCKKAKFAVYKQYYIINLHIYIISNIYFIEGRKNGDEKMAPLANRFGASVRKLGICSAASQRS
jgi:hypothetical protein